MINIADNPAVLQQLVEASKVAEASGPASIERDRPPGEAADSPAYPAKVLELVDGRYRVVGVEK